MLRLAYSHLGVAAYQAAAPVAAAACTSLLRAGNGLILPQQLQTALSLKHATHAADAVKAPEQPAAASKVAPQVAPHPSLLSPHTLQPQVPIEKQAAAADRDPDVANAMALPVYDMKYLLAVKPYHIPPVERHQRVAYNTIQAVRKVFDAATGYGPNMTEQRWLRRIIFLETVAGVPGMVAGMLRHLRSLRSMQRDAGWINTLLAEAENERMHLLTFLELRRPGRLFRGAVLLAQGLMFNALFLAYLASPRTVHAMVGYLEEEAVRTYTHALEDIDAGKLWAGKPAPPFARAYWRLPEDATMRDLILVVRADEACHSHVNHTFSGMKGHEPNPFGVGSHQVP